MRPTPTFRHFNDAQRHALDAGRNLAVRANAGSGKTSVMVERMVQILARSFDAGTPLELAAVVALTFTRKAAAELQERLRLSFLEMAGAAGNGDEQRYWNSCIDALPGAMIGTIDSFCARVLRDLGHLDETPPAIEPTFEPLSDHDELALKREAIERVLDRLHSLPAASYDPEERARAEACGWWGHQQGFAALTKHLVTLLNHTVDPAVIIAAHSQPGPATERIEAAWAMVPAVRRLNSGRRQLASDLQDLSLSIEQLRSPGERLQELRDRVATVLAALANPGREADEAALKTLGEALLTQEGTPRVQGLAAVAQPVGPLQETWGPLLADFEFDFEGELRATEAADRLALLLEPVHEEYLQLCRFERRYDFLTVARRTRDLLRRSRAARQDLKERYRFVMVDEFQDTNHLQWEIISWVAGDGPEKPLDADRLFIVGDPQQSIYRFRHADVGVFARAREHLRDSNQRHAHVERPTAYEAEHPGAAPSTPEQRLGLMPLGENYRALVPLPLELIDRVFQHVFDPVAHGLDVDGNPFEVVYQPLLPGLPRSDVDSAGEVCYLIPPTSNGDEEEDIPPADGEAPVEVLGLPQTSAVVAQLIRCHGGPRRSPRPGQPATLSWGDMAVLLPSRDVVLVELEKEFRRRGVPFRVHKGIGFWQRQEVRDVVNLAQSLAEPDDDLALFAVLRGPAGQLTDDEILFLSQLGRRSLGRGLARLGAGAGQMSSAGHVSAARMEDPHAEREDYDPTRVGQVANLPDQRGPVELAGRLDSPGRQVSNLPHGSAPRVEDREDYDPTRVGQVANLPGQRWLRQVSNLPHGSAPRAEDREDYDPTRVGQVANLPGQRGPVELAGPAGRLDSPGRQVSNLPHESAPTRAEDREDYDSTRVGVFPRRVEDPHAEREDYDPVQAALDVTWRSFTPEAQERLRQTCNRLQSWRENVDRLTHVDLLQRALEESSAYAIYAADLEGELIFANLGKLFDEIRALEERSPASLSRRSRGLRALVEESVKEEQAATPPGDDAVQVMTVHAAKGLEFPVVAVMKMERKADRGSHAPLLVKSAWDRLLADDAAELLDVPPGTLAVRIRNPRRPREFYVSRLLRAMHRLDRAQDVAESRRLFYVAATRAQERLILAGKQPRTRQDGRPAKLLESWQKWFEEALGITESDKANGLWTDPVRSHRLIIVADLQSAGPVVPPPPYVPTEVLDLAPLLATSDRTIINLDDWLATARGGERRARHVLTGVVGALVERMQAEPHEPGRTSDRQRWQRMAEALFVLTQAHEDVAAQLTTDPQMVARAVAAGQRFLAEIRSETAKAARLRQLLAAPGDSLVPFALRLGRWSIVDRFDKLLPRREGYEIVAWDYREDGEPEASASTAATQDRLSLLALALYRSGQAALNEGRVIVHHVQLRQAEARTCFFPPATLEELMRKIEA